MSEPLNKLSERLATPVDEARLQSNWRAVRRRQAQRGVRRAWRNASAVSVAACALVGWIVYGNFAQSPATEPIAVEAPPGPLAWIRTEQVANGAALATFADGSRIHVGPDGRFEMTENTGSLFRVHLRAGWARFDVTPGGPRRWIVDAGVAQVEVVGTSFTVLRDEEGVRVRVHHGQVLVRSTALSGGQRRLGSGQNVSVPLAARANRAARPEPVEATREKSPARPPRKASRRAPARQAPHTGGRRALARADALRANGQFAEAAAALQHELSERPRGVLSGLVSFTLAQLELDELARPEQAARHLAQANLSRSLPAALREQACARRVEALARAGQMDQARAAAADYERRYPGGAWLDSVRTWVDGRSVGLP